MKIAITGHTSGLGKCLLDTLSSSHEVYGFSRSNGYDISTDLDKLVNEIADFDVLINNAFHETGQLELLQRMHTDVWSKQPKIIINVGSVTAHKRPGFKYGIPPEYVTAKITLRKYIDNVYVIGTLPNIVYVAPGFMDTPRVANTNFPNKTDPQVVANAIINVLQSYINDNVIINQLVISPKPL
jgi:hypothetical protein